MAPYQDSCDLSQHCILSPVLVTLAEISILEKTSYHIHCTCHFEESY